MLPDRVPFLLEHVGDVDPGRDVLVGHERLGHERLELRDLLGRRVLGRHPEAALAGGLEPLVHRLADRGRDRLLVELLRLPGREPAILDGRTCAAVLGRQLLRVPGRIAGPRERRHGHLVDPDVVGMAVAAERVVGRHDVGPVPPDEPDQPADRFVEVGLPERPRIVVPGPAHHVRVAVAEVVPFGDAEDAHRVLELAHPDLAEPAVVLGRVHLGDDDLALLAARAGDEHDPPAVADRSGHRPAGADRLVVGMGVDGHERESVVGFGRGRRGGVGHVPIVARAAPEPSTGRVQTALRSRPMEPSNPAMDAVEAAGVPFTVKRTERARSAEESAAFQGIELGDLLRTIVVRRGEDDFLFVLVPAGRPVRLAAPALLGVTRLSLPDADEARTVTGYERGTITPFGSSRAWPVVADATIVAGHVSRSAVGPTA